MREEVLAREQSKVVNYIENCVTRAGAENKEEVDKPCRKHDYDSATVSLSASAVIQRPSAIPINPTQTLVFLSSFDTPSSVFFFLHKLERISRFSS